MPIAINLKKETACTLDPINILKPHSAYTILDLISSLVMRNFTLFFINLKTKFKIFSLKKSPPSKK
ncbi:hypothetical protein HPIN_05540 [Helicobacter pylori India7]|uniref:Uncharacterized protein n=1 Tax=Helicobacter pylori (strain India7) TaxID=907238 RepID=E8QH47_HELP7|nr:hypothetical protein HPIN_05540 [Helicobacter pylori India7]